LQTVISVLPLRKNRTNLTTEATKKDKNANQIGKENIMQQNSLIPLEIISGVVVFIVTLRVAFALIMDGKIF